ncbi:hypothetical protein CTA1_278 [Colletotrichum tanaceti]|uniref:Uncharacterized protein n=1 Tax=Colletotrichum tanaceti TaxID=1306861 RepID=A0A4V6DFR5_9PEZI|nr:hypothetical protein CTA1_278 [Colletotrichum tanaceti]
MFSSDQQQQTEYVYHLISRRRFVRFASFSASISGQIAWSSFHTPHHQRTLLLGGGGGDGGGSGYKSHSAKIMASEKLYRISLIRKATKRILVTSVIASNPTKMACMIARITMAPCKTSHGRRSIQMTQIQSGGGAAAKGSEQSR